MSRVGGSAQTKAMKQVSGSLRLDLAAYRELAGFTQFGSDLDAATQKQLTHGARMTELLKQPRFKPFDVTEQIVALFAGNKGFVDDLPVSQVLPFRNALLDYMTKTYAPLLDKLRSTKIDDELDEQLMQAISDFKNDYAAKLAETSASNSGAEEN